MSGFRREQQNEQSSGWGWALGLGAAAALVGGTAAYLLVQEEKRYTNDRHTHLKQCENEFVTAEELLHGGDLRYGDMVEFKRSYYQHWALYVGGGYVIHVNDKGRVVKEKLLDAGRGSICRVNLLKKKADELELTERGPRRVIVEYAEKMVGKQLDYDLCERNCEHFVTECFYGTAFSVQQDILNQNSTARFFGRVGCATLPHD